MGQGSLPGRLSGAESWELQLLCCSVPPAPCVSPISSDTYVFGCPEPHRLPPASLVHGLVTLSLPTLIASCWKLHVLSLIQESFENSCLGFVCLFPFSLCSFYHTVWFCSFLTLQPHFLVFIDPNWEGMTAAVCSLCVLTHGYGLSGF